MADRLLLAAAGADSEATSSYGLSQATYRFDGSSAAFVTALHETSGGQAVLGNR